MLVSTLPASATLIMLTSVHIGRAIDHYRRLAGLSQLELAGRLGWDQGNLSRLIRGQQDIPYRRLCAIAGALGVKTSDLVSYAENGDDQAARWHRLYVELPEEDREAALRLLEPRAVTYRVKTSRD